MKTIHRIALAAALLAPALSHAGFMSINLPGTTESAAWADLTSANYTSGDGYNSFMSNTAGWDNPIAATSGSTSAVFDKTAGYGGLPQLRLTLQL